MVSLLASTDATRGNIQVIKTTIADVDKEAQDDYKGSSFLAFGTCTFLHETKLQLKKDKVYGLLGSTMWQDHTHAGDPGGESGKLLQA